MNAYLLALQSLLGSFVGVELAYHFAYCRCRRHRCCRDIARYGRGGAIDGRRMEGTTEEKVDGNGKEELNISLAWRTSNHGIDDRTDLPDVAGHVDSVRSVNTVTVT